MKVPNFSTCLCPYLWQGGPTESRPTDGTLNTLHRVEAVFFEVVYMQDFYKAIIIILNSNSLRLKTVWSLCVNEIITRSVTGNWAPYLEHRV